MVAAMPSVAKYTLVIFGIFAFWIGIDELVLKGTELVKAYPLLTSVPYLAAIVFLIFMDSVAGHVPIPATLQQYGFRRPRPVQVRIAGIGIAIVILGYFAVSRIWAGAFQLSPHWQTAVIKFFLEAGFAEEVVFRGFLFRKLRASRSFLRAATLSGIVFGATHLINLVNGLTPDVVIGTAISVTFGFLMTYPFAALFEIGGGSLLGGVIFHLAIDSVNFFGDLDAGAMLGCLAVAFVSGAAVFISGYKRLKHPN
jgi:membrane protease YdiL (CAAX protease family)